MCVFSVDVCESPDQYLSTFFGSAIYTTVAALFEAPFG